MTTRTSEHQKTYLQYINSHPGCSRADCIRATDIKTHPQQGYAALTSLIRRGFVHLRDGGLHVTDKGWRVRRVGLALGALLIVACGLIDPSTGQAPPRPQGGYVHVQDYTPIVYQRRDWFASCPRGHSTERIKCAMKKERAWEESAKR